MNKLLLTTKQLIHKYGNKYSTPTDYWGPYGVFMMAKKLNKITKEGWQMFFPDNINKLFEISTSNRNTIRNMQISSMDTLLTNFRRIKKFTEVPFV
jgi:hypothetical protein